MREESLLTRISSFAVVLILAWFTVFARIYVRLFMKKKFGLDDWLLLFTLLGFTVMSVLIMVMVKLGLGVKDEYLSQHDISEVFKLRYYNEFLYIVTTVILKISIAFMLLRFAVAQLSRRIIIFTAVFYTLCGVVFLFTIIFQCKPIAYNWDSSIHGTCIHLPIIVAMIYSNAVISLITDAVFAILPIVLIWDIQMDKKTKFTTGFVLSLGLTTNIVNIARFFFIGQFKAVENQLYKFYPIHLLSNLEVGIGIIAASLATIRPLLQHILGSSGGLQNSALSWQRKSSRCLMIDETNADTLSLKLSRSSLSNAKRRKRDEDNITSSVDQDMESDLESWMASCSAP